jgi:hypothetical protein
MEDWKEAIDSLGIRDELCRSLDAFLSGRNANIEFHCILALFYKARFFSLAKALHESFSRIIKAISMQEECKRKLWNSIKLRSQVYLFTALPVGWPCFEVNN